jgi:hypothetical protein
MKWMPGPGFEAASPHSGVDDEELRISRLFALVENELPTAESALL